MASVHIQDRVASLRFPPERGLGCKVRRPRTVPPSQGHICN